MIYLIPAAFFTGIAIGYIVAALIEDTNKAFKRHEEYLEATRKSLEKVIIESGLAQEVLERKSEEDK